MDPTKEVPDFKVKKGGYLSLKAGPEIFLFFFKGSTTFLYDAGSFKSLAEHKYVRTDRQC
jgi:hypothetical protein